LGMLPDVIRRGHVYTIKIGSGLDDQPLIINDITVNGELIIEGMTENKDQHKIYRLYADKITGFFNIRNLTTTVKTASQQSFRFRRCPFVDVYNVEAEADPEIERGPEGVIGMLVDYGSNARIRQSTFKDKRYGIRVNYLSRVFVHNCDGDNNVFGVGARWGGIAQVWGTTPTGTSNTLSSDSVGMVLERSLTTRSHNNEPHLIEA